MKIKDLCENARPRERAESVGMSNISDSELLAILIGSGTRADSAIGLANKLLLETGDIYNLGRIDLGGLTIKGLGPVKKILLEAAIEIGKRATRVEGGGEDLFIPEQIFERFHPYFYGLIKERLMLILLDSKHRKVYSTVQDSELYGSVNLTCSWIIKKAATIGAPFAIIIHNHPSGRKEPSSSDDESTTMIRWLLQLLGITLIDHLIFTDDAYFSYAKSGFFSK